MLQPVTTPTRQRRRGVGEVDRKLIRLSARLPASRADQALRALSRAANHGVLWWAVAAVLAIRKGPTRRGGLRGAAAIAGASTSANLIGKRLFPRRRPAAEEVPVYRRLIKRPTSSSFPSGHSASAAAFATAVAMEAPSAGVVVSGLAALVAYSRVHTGVHWPSDVGAGALIGAGAAMATRHWWPLHPDVPAHTAHRAQAPVIRDGDDMLVVVNPASGDATFDPIKSCRKAWPAAHFVYPERDTDLRAQLQREIDARDGGVHALGGGGWRRRHRVRLGRGRRPRGGRDRGWRREQQPALVRQHRQPRRVPGDGALA